MTPRRAKPKLVVSWMVAPGEEAEVRFSNAWTDDGIPVMGKLRPVDGVLRLQELTFGPVGAMQEVSSGTLRRIRLDAVLAEVRAEAAKGGEQFDEMLSDETYTRNMTQYDGLIDSARAIARAGRAAAKRPPSGSRGWGEDFYRMVAAEYIQMTREGQATRGVLPRLAERLQKRMGETEPRHRDNVRDWVAEARRRGFLVPVGRGRAGALPGPNLIERTEHDG